MPHARTSFRCEASVATRDMRVANAAAIKILRQSHQTENDKLRSSSRARRRRPRLDVPFQDLLRARCLPCRLSRHAAREGRRAATTPQAASSRARASLLANGVASVRIASPQSTVLRRVGSRDERTRHHTWTAPDGMPQPLRRRPRQGPQPRDDVGDSRGRRWARRRDGRRADHQLASSIGAAGSLAYVSSQAVRTTRRRERRLELLSPRLSKNRGVSCP